MSTSHKCRIGVLTDIHWKSSEENQIRHQMERALSNFEHRGISRLVILGDLIQEGETEEESRQHLLDALQYFNKLDMPVTFLLGNHDVIHTSSDTYEAITQTDPEHGTFEMTDDVTGIYVDTSAPEYPDARGKLGQEEQKYLDQQLEQAKYAVVFSHHPLYYHNLSDNQHFNKYPEAAFASDKYRANEIFEKHGNVVATVNGHTHLSHHTTYEDIPRFTINAFSQESPDHSRPNGSFAVLDVNQKRLKRTSFTRGSYTGQKVIDYPTKSEKVALGGTFGPIHDGHRQMFQRAFEIGDVFVGLTSEELSQETRHTEREVPDFNERKRTLKSELEKYATIYNREYKIVELNDPMGYVTTDNSFTHLIVSPETFSGGEKVNKTRLNNGLRPLNLEVVDPVLAEDGQRISSTRIVHGEIDQNGNLLD